MSDPFVVSMMQGDLLCLKWKPLLVKTTLLVWGEGSKGLGCHSDLGYQNNAQWGEHQIKAMKKGMFTYPFMKNMASNIITNLKPHNYFISCTKFKMTTWNRSWEAIHLGQWAVLLNITRAYCHIPIVKRHQCFHHFRWIGKIYQFKTWDGVCSSCRSLLHLELTLQHQGHGPSPCPKTRYQWERPRLPK